ncbi:hypothetical protein [Bacillus sp. FJAT-27445]|uniref:hypothetical protein n=1 Tax=Bacillus sp. FJAT-27445 TaxID=1679166 RepID=UPI0007439D89|nr:hypothetical protein [Bacillus sp. FJAT-27445]
MGGALIIGVFDRLGFHLCKKMLELGYVIRGISLNTENTETEEEMELEIGRNSNFINISMDSINANQIENDAIIFSLYDLYTSGVASNLEKPGLADEVEKYIRKHKGPSSVVLLLPLGLSHQNPGQEGIQVIKRAADFAETTAEKVLRLYLPLQELPPLQGEEEAGSFPKKAWPEDGPAGRKAGEEFHDWYGVAERIAMLIEKGETGTRFLEDICIKK